MRTPPRDPRGVPRVKRTTMSVQPEPEESVVEQTGMRYYPESGRLEYEFWSAQREALDAYLSGEYDIVALLGGYGSGKTVTGSNLVITLAWDQPGSKWLANAIDFQKGDETTFETLFEQLPGERTHILTSNHNGPENSPIVADYNRQKHRLTLTNDSVIRLGSADHPDSVIGDEFAGAWLDEPSKYHPNNKLYQLGLDTVPSRLRDHDPQLGQFWTLTGNGYNAAYKILSERKNADDEEINQRIKIVYASTLNNPYLDEKTKEKQARQFGGSAKEDQALHGGFDAAEGLVYDFDRERHLAPLDVYTEENSDGEEIKHIAINHNGRTIPIDASYRLYGYDAGWHPDPRAFLELGKTAFGNRLVVLDEYRKTRTHLKDGIRWLNERQTGVVAAEHEPEDIEEMEKEGIPAIRANKSLDPGIAEVSDWLNPRDEETGGRLPPRLLVSDRCDMLVNEFNSYKQEDKGGSAAEDHLLDCLRYAIMAVKDGEDVPPKMGFGTVQV